MVYSYDVFDTVITRRTANPHGIFAIMRDKMKKMNNFFSEELAENFFEWRIQGERLARYFYCENEEITLKKIYRAIGTTGVLSDGIIMRLMELECETELENVVPIPQIVDQILEHLEKNEKVLFISDMYLDKETIYQMLIKADVRFSRVPLYVSSETGKTKASGNLFRLIHEKEQIPYTQWMHTGDNKVSDIKIPQKMGIKTNFVESCSLISIEKAVLSGMGDDAYTQLLIGISKNARAIYGLTGSGIVGASLSGILLGSYVKWILKDALNRGIKTLYFVARDGYILKQAADIFIKKMDLDISTKYIYGSRKAWRIQAQAPKNKELLALLYASVPEFLRDLESVSNIFEISLSELLNFLPQSMPKKNLGLSKLDVEVLFYYLSELESFCLYIERIYKKKFKLVQRYLQQEIDLQNEQVAFVEVGGTGYTQKCMGNILKEVYDGSIATYFFSLYSVEEQETYTFYNFIPDGLYIKDAIEPLCRALHGQTLGYKENNHCVEPVLEWEDQEIFSECGYDKYIKGFLAYAEIYMNYYREIFEKPVNHKILRKCWNYYTHVNDEEILNFVGEVPFEVTGKENKHAKYAPKLSREEIKDIFYTHRDEPISWHYQGASLNMSLLRMEKEEKKLFERYKEESERLGDIENADTKRVYEQHMFAHIPQSRYSPETRIVIYGAGNVGKAFYYHALEKQNFRIVLWVDKQSRRYTGEGYPVFAPEQLLELEFDIVIISVLDRKIKNEIRKNLLQMGIAEEKIDWISPEELLGGYYDE